MQLHRETNIDHRWRAARVSKNFAAGARRVIPNGWWFLLTAALSWGVPRRGGFSLYLSTPPGLVWLVPAGELTWLGRRCPGRPRAGTPAAGPHSSIPVTPVTAGNYRVHSATYLDATVFGPKCTRYREYTQ